MDNFPLYAKTADDLADRIRALDPNKVAACEGPFDLHKIEGFKCDDLQPSLAQASVALRVVQREIGGG